MVLMVLRPAGSITAFQHHVTRSLRRFHVGSLVFILFSALWLFFRHWIFLVALQFSVLIQCSVVVYFTSYWVSSTQPCGVKMKLLSLTKRGLHQPFPTGFKWRRGSSALEVSSSLALWGEMCILMKTGLHQPDPTGCKWKRDFIIP